MRRIEAVVVLASLAWLGAARAEEVAFRYRAAIQVERPGAFLQMTVPVSAYARSLQPGLRDLRVVDARGERVPFALLPSRVGEMRSTDTTHEARLYPLPARPKDGSTWLAPIELTVEAGRISVVRRSGSPPASSASPGWLLDLGERRAGDPQPQSLRLAWATPSEFSVGYGLETSDDLRRWQPAGEGQVMSLVSTAGVMSQPVVPLPASIGRFVRLVWTVQADAPVLTGADVVSTRLSQSAVETPAEIVSAASPMPASEAQRAPVDKSGSGADRALHFDLGAVLPLVDIDLQLGAGTRVAPVRLEGRRSADEAWQALASAVFYRLERDGGVSRSPAVPLQASVRYVRVSPDERAAALDAGQTRLVAHAALASLVFAAQGQAPFALLAGAAGAGEGALPVSTLLPSPLDEERPRFGRASLGSWSEVAAVAQQVRAERRQAEWRPWLLWAVLLVGVASLGFMVWRLAGGAARASEP